jgi:hypothetical protein
MIFVALDSISGFRETRLKYVRLLNYEKPRALTEHEKALLDITRAKLTRLIYEHVLSNGDGAGVAFIERNKLSTLASVKRDFLERTDSFGALIRFAVNAGRNPHINTDDKHRR